MEELSYIDLAMGVFWILSGLLFQLYPRLVWGYRKWSKERQESFNIVGFARLLSITIIIFGTSFIVSSFFGCGDRILTVGVIVLAFITIFMDRFFYKKPSPKNK